MSFEQWDKIASNHGVALALSLAANVVLSGVIAQLWRENRTLWRQRWGRRKDDERDD